MRYIYTIINVACIYWNSMVQYKSENLWRFYILLTECFQRVREMTGCSSCLPFSFCKYFHAVVMPHIYQTKQTHVSHYFLCVFLFGYVCVSHRLQWRDAVEWMPVWYRMKFSQVFTSLVALKMCSLHQNIYI